jgi:hypothetical protein
LSSKHSSGSSGTLSATSFAKIFSSFKDNARTELVVCTRQRRSVAYPNHNSCYYGARRKVSLGQAQ